MSLNNLSKTFIPFLVIILMVPALFIPTILNNTDFKVILPEIYEKFDMSNSSFCWPVPGYTKISSYFGKRNSPTKGASSFHQGIDIPAPYGTNLISVFSGIVSFIGFNGSAGYSIHIKNDNLEFFYHHVSPKYIVKTGDYVYSGQIIGQVGPKNVYNVPNNPYKDSNGKPTNGATTGPHLHFTIKKDGKAVNPLIYFS
jgi:murein DD-endopeptidase MepM/ murein hydrolase activator NlpD